MTLIFRGVWWVKGGDLFEAGGGGGGRGCNFYIKNNLKYETKIFNDFNDKKSL